MRPRVEAVDEHVPLPPLAAAGAPDRNPPGRLRHAAAIVASHWISVLLVVMAAATVLSRELIEERTWRVLLLEAHRQFGLLVLGALVVRLVLRARKGLANTAGGMHPVLKLAAVLTHWLLYGLLLAIPLLGWALTNAHDTALHLFGVVPLPSLVSGDPDLADNLTDQHVLASWVLLGAVGAHALAALWHHFVRKDQVLSAMLPRRSRRALRQPEERPARAAA